MARRNQRADAPKDPYAAITEERFFARTRVEFFASENFERNSYSRQATASLRAKCMPKEPHTRARRLPPLIAHRSHLLLRRYGAQESTRGRSKGSLRCNYRGKIFRAHPR